MSYGSTQPTYSGLTVNERLIAAGLIEQLEAAIQAGERSLMIRVLDRLDLADQSGSIAEAILDNPGRYGFRWNPNQLGLGQL